MTRTPHVAEDEAMGSPGCGEPEEGRSRRGALTPGVGLGLTAAAAALFFGGAAALSGGRSLGALALLPVFAFLLPALLLARWARAERRVLPWARPPMRWVLGGGGVMLGASLSALALAGGIGRWVGPGPGEEKLGEWVSGCGPWWGFLVLALVPGVCEEVFFRGALLACLRPWGPLPACLASGLLFAVFHGSVLRFLPVAVLGVALAAVVWLTGNLWLAVAGHVFHNALVLIALHEYGVGREPGGAALALWGVCGASLVAGGLGLLRRGSGAGGGGPVGPARSRGGYSERERSGD